MPTVIYTSTNNYQVKLQKGSVEQTKNIVMIVNIAPDPDIALVTDAKNAIEDASFVPNIAQANFNTNDTLLKTEIARQINILNAMDGLNIIISADDINITNFMAAKAETIAGADGVNGHFDFSVSIKKAAQEQFTASKRVIISATAFGGLTDTQAIVAAKPSISTAISNIVATNATTAAAILAVANNAATNDVIASWDAEPIIIPATATAAGSINGLIKVSKGSITDTITVSLPVIGKIYTITFDPNGGTISPNTAITTADGQLAVLPSPTISGSYRFDGWFSKISNGLPITTAHIFDGDDIIYAQWIKVEVSKNDNTPEAPPSAESEEIATIDNEDIDDHIVSIDIAVNSTINSDTNTARASIPDNAIEEAVADALSEVDDNAPKVIIEIETPANASGIEATLSSELLADLAANEHAQFEIKSNAGSLNFDQTALNSVVEQAAGADLTLVIRKVEDEQELSAKQQETVGDAPVYELYIESSGNRISDFSGGEVSVVVPEELEMNDGDTMVVFYIDDEGNTEQVTATYDALSGMVTFATKHFSHYVIMIERSLNPDSNLQIGSLPFTDVPTEAWYYQDMLFVHTNQLMNGIQATIFEPNGIVSRAMMAQIIWNMENKPAIIGENPFNDIIDGAWYHDVVVWSAINGIYKGLNAYTFAPDEAITREQLAAIFYRYAAYKGYDLSPSNSLENFIDSSKVSTWAIEAMQWAVGSGLINGSDNNALNPQGTATRAEIAAIISRFATNVADADLF